MRTNTILALLLAGSLAACGGVRDDSDGMMDEGSGMMEDASQMDDVMAPDMMQRPAMGEESSAMDDAMHDGSMPRDTLQMQGP